MTESAAGDTSATPNHGSIPPAASTASLKPTGCSAGVLRNNSEFDSLVLTTTTSRPTISAAQR
jgi:hypothetical protein